jgi:hypothetical protein
MTTIQRGTVYLFTFKDGLLARLAHDLRLSAERFEVHIDGDQVKGRFWSTSLRVDGAIKNGAIQPGELSDGDKKTILENALEKVLFAHQHPEVAFAGSVTSQSPGRHAIDGRLTLVGQTRPIRVEVREEQGFYRGEVELQPSQWGIPPFKALAGAIKLQDRLRLVFSLEIP